MTAASNDAKGKKNFGQLLRRFLKRSDVAISFGIIGFVLSIVILTHNYDTSPEISTAFREMALVSDSMSIKQKLVDFNAGRKDTLVKLYKRLSNRLDTLKNKPSDDNIKPLIDLIKDSSSRTAQSIKKINQEIYEIQYTNKDTLVKFFQNYYSVDKDVLAQALYNLDGSAEKKERVKTYTVEKKDSSKDSAAKKDKKNIGKSVFRDTFSIILTIPLRCCLRCLYGILLLLNSSAGLQHQSLISHQNIPFSVYGYFYPVHRW
jgi:hypothetical protein